MDGRNRARIDHSILEMLGQRIYGLELGYEDINDHEQLRKDPVFGILAGREELDEPLAGKSTLNRMELSAGAKDRYTNEKIVPAIFGALLRPIQSSNPHPEVTAGQGLWKNRLLRGVLTHHRRRVRYAG